MAAAKSFNGYTGKLLDTWYYEYEGIDRTHERSDAEDFDNPEPRPDQTVSSQKVAVELRMLKKYTGDTPPLAVKGVEFLVVCKPAGINMTGTDIEALRVAVWGILDKKYAVRWERWYLIQVNDSPVYSGRGAGLMFSYEHVEKGIAWDGTLLLRQLDGWRRKISPWPGEFKDRSGSVTACIPDTAANTAALEDFARRVTTLRKHLASFFRPDTVLHTLAALSGSNALLPPPKEE